MTVASLRAAIKKRSEELMISKLEEIGLIYHKKRWRDCPCSWCAKKREATVVIATTPPHRSGYYVTDMRDSWRDGKRMSYRKQLEELEGG